MVIQERPIPLDLLIFRVLLARMQLSESEMTNFKVRQKGYEGELKSDEWLKGLNDQLLVLHGLLLEYDGSRFQIDTLIIANEKIYLLDVKYYEGDYYLEDDKWFTKTNPNLKNPLHQLSRCETLFRKLLLSLGYNYPTESYLIFNNPEFHLYITTINTTLIFPSQLDRFLKKLNMRPVKLIQRYHNLAQQLAALHIVDSPYSRVPSYKFETLKRGLFCPKCYLLYFDIGKDLCICNSCGCIEGVDEVVLRNVKEYMLLFPDRKVTVKDIYEWCGGMKSKKTIWRVLSKHFIHVEKGRKSNYIIKNDKNNTFYNGSFC
ncbi:nuclease-related domain-containing protein [Neobacillus sp. K501]